ncbi:MULTISPECIES: C40 family peptidase [Bacillus]|uniref:C40 family peptidase n=1 Tax=Bacillus TaxID=1386 RepID=UPI000BB8176B|nr:MULTISPECIES: C40 family peptidase [Bacillus]
MRKKLLFILLVFTFLFTTNSTFATNSITVSNSQQKIPLFSYSKLMPFYSSVTNSPFALFVAQLPDEKKRYVNGCVKPKLEKGHVVNVAATSLWLEPGENRSLDEPSLTTPVDLEKWTKSLSVDHKLWLVGKLETQALYGQEVTILQSKGDWIEVAVHDQSTPKNATGYPGWVPASHISEVETTYPNCKLAIVDANTTTLYHNASFSNPFMDISFNTRLPVVKEGADWIKVYTPADEFKYMRKEHVLVVDNESSIPKPQPGDVVESGMKFLGLPYLWAGTTGYGYDCSGFTHSVYKRHGIYIPRDASAQFKAGIAVAKSDLQPGDLLFFAYENGKGSVHHVGMYIGNGQMIHSPNSSKSIEIVSFQTGIYAAEYAGARRYID